MAIYCIDDGGDGTQTNTTQTATTLDWSKADTTIANLIAYDAAAFTTSGNIIYFGHNTAQSQASALTITGPTSGAPVILISADIGQTTPTYLASSTNQIQTTGANAITFNGSFALYGLKMVSGAGFTFDSDQDESFYMESCTVVPANGAAIVPTTANGRFEMVGGTIDLTADTSNSNTIIQSGSNSTIVDIRNVTISNGGNRTGYIFYIIGGSVSGCDLSSCTGTTLFHPLLMNTQLSITNCKTANNPTLLSTSFPYAAGSVLITNCDDEDWPQMMTYRNYFGTVTAAPGSTASVVYRSSGASVETCATGWLITTQAACTEKSPFYTPWIYGTTTNGTRTFTVYGCAVNSSPITATPTDAQIWLEVETLSTADVAKFQLSNDRRTITTTAADQTTETSSTWNNLTESFRFKLECASVSVGESGQYRARVAVGIPSVTSSSSLYIDPLVTVT